jgi:hypothetical protein
MDIERITTEQNVVDLSYTLYCFHICFGTEPRSEDEDFGRDEDPKIEELRRWFVKYADPKLFEYYEGSYIGKRSMQMTLYYTKWLQDRNLYCHSYEGDKRWYYERIFDYDNGCYKRQPKSQSSQKLADILDPLSQKDVMIMFDFIDKSNNDEQFMFEFVKFLHCAVFDSDFDFSKEEETPYIHFSYDCSRFNY